MRQSSIYSVLRLLVTTSIGVGLIVVGMPNRALSETADPTAKPAEAVVKKSSAAHNCPIDKSRIDKPDAFSSDWLDWLRDLTLPVYLYPNDDDSLDSIQFLAEAAVENAHCVAQKARAYGAGSNEEIKKFAAVIEKEAGDVTRVAEERMAEIEKLAATAEDDPKPLIKSMQAIALRPHPELSAVGEASEKLWQAINDPASTLHHGTDGKPTLPALQDKIVRRSAILCESKQASEDASVLPDNALNRIRCQMVEKFRPAKAGEP